MVIQADLINKKTDRFNIKVGYVKVIQMKKKLILILLMLFGVTGCSSSNITEEDIKKAEEYIKAEEEFIYEPCKKEKGDKFTIGVIDIDPYYPSGEMLYWVVNELIDKGWIDSDISIPFEPDRTDVKELVNYLAGKNLGEYIEFSKEANYYIAIDGEEECSESLNKLIENNDVDLLICLGTIPGAFAEKTVKGRIPVMIYFSIDPVSAGLINDGNYSNVENVWAHISTESYEKQLRYYSNIFKFNNIGMIYYDESVAAMKMYRRAAEEEGFKIRERKIERIDTSSAENKELYYNNLKNVIYDLIENENIDAFMLNTDIIVDEEVINEVCNIFYDNKIPVFVQTGEEFVKNGALMTVVTMDAKQQASFFVNTMAGIFNGKGTDEMPQKYVSASFPVVNMTAAQKIGYDIPGEILEYAEKIYY